MICPYSHSDGGYVLGALSPADRSAYESHLADCAACSAAVARLAPLPGLLRRVDPASLGAPRPDPAPLPRLLHAVAVQRRRLLRNRRWRYAVGVLMAVVLAVLGTGVWLGSDRASPDPPPAVAMQEVAGSAPVTAEVAVARTAGGTQVWMVCRYPGADYQAPASTFWLVAVGADGSSEPLGSWSAAPGDEVSLTGLTRLKGDDLVRLELRGAAGTPLLAHDLSRGS
jgi:anti-sigma-K factor RskA